LLAAGHYSIVSGTRPAITAGLCAIIQNTPYVPVPMELPKPFRVSDTGAGVKMAGTMKRHEQQEHYSIYDN
jgi:hypothetical protein